VDDATRSNLELWEEWTDLHVASEFYDVDSFIRGTRPIRISPRELEAIGEVRGKDLLHLQCHFGMDTLSFARLGARVTGADFSPKAIAAARKLASDCGLEANFVCSDLYALPDQLQGDFDIVYTSRGVIWWLRDIQGWGRVVAHFLRPGGVFYITEMHPFLLVFDDDDGVTDLRVRYPYSTHGRPLSFPTSGSYADRSAKLKTQVEYGWSHGLGEIVTSLADAGLRIERLSEEHSIPWPRPYLVQVAERDYRLPGDLEGTVPLMFSLRASKPGIR
jgi:SAM-dependent methyltransferase